MRIIFLGYFLIISSLSSLSYAEDIIDKYPSYSYIFYEFDIEDDYIYDDKFNSFIEKKHTLYKIFYHNSLDRGGYLIPTFKSMLMQDNLSDLFVYLAMVESGFKTNAKSPKSAMGIWQFMEATAKQYKLDVNSNFDERLDPILATSAAMRYLHKLHKDFGKWYLVMMAYNCGEGRLQKAIDRAGTDELHIVIEYIPKETRLYIYKILLVAMIGENISLGFSQEKESIELLYSSDVVQVEVEAGESIKRVAKIIDIEYNDLLKINHHFKGGTVPVLLPRYMMNIPSDKVIDFYTLYILKKELKKSPKNYFISHKVVKGEKLNEIAIKYNSTSFELMDINSLNRSSLNENQILIIPVTKTIFIKFSKHL